MKKQFFCIIRGEKRLFPTLWGVNWGKSLLSLFSLSQDTNFTSTTRTVRTSERANQTLDNTITKMLDLPRNTHHRQHWEMAFTHASKIKNRLPLQGRTSELLNPSRFPLQPYGTFVSAHVPLVNQNNGSGRSILGYYLRFSKDHRGGILVFNPHTRTTTVRHTYKALGLVECLDDNIYGTDRTDAVQCCILTTFAYSFYCPRLEYVCCWCRDRSGQSQRCPCCTISPFCAHFHNPQVAFMRCLLLTVLSSMKSFATYSPHIVPPHHLLDRTYHSQLFGMALIINGSTLVHILSLSNHFCVT